MAVIAAKRRKIPIFHMEAGNRCFDQRVPEEINRKIIDHTADINLVYSDIERGYLLNEGFAPDRLIKTGSPMFEVLAQHKNSYLNSDIVAKFGLTSEQYFVVSAHREENIDDDSNLMKLVTALNAVATTYNEPIIFSTHPRTQKKLDAKGITFHPLVRLLKPLGFHDYIKLQISAHVVLSDSGTISEEASILNFPALTLREMHERPEGFEETAILMTGLEIDRILQGITILSTQGRGEQRDFNIVADYAKPNVADKMVRIIQSYTDYVNRVVWKKHGTTYGIT
jgi:UDP-N-acetylglucosamine 2-epimerase (non-hydrolysing)